MKKKKEKEKNVKDIIFCVISFNSISIMCFCRMATVERKRKREEKRRRT